MYLADYAKEYVTLRDGCEGYLTQLIAACRKLEAHAGRQLRPDELSCQLINDMLREEKTRLSPRTRRNYRTSLACLHAFAADDQTLAKRPETSGRLAVVKVPEHVVRTWTTDQVRQLLNTAMSLVGEYGGRGGMIWIPKSPYWTAWILAAWDTGWRGCDLRSLEHAWIPAHGRLVIQQRKTGRVVASTLRPETIAAIRDLAAATGSRLAFPMWCRLEAWRAAAAVLVRRAGLRGSIGWLRSAAATAVEREHPGVGHLLLGHASRGTFVRHYCDQTQLDAVPLPPSLIPAARIDRDCARSTA